MTEEEKKEKAKEKREKELKRLNRLVRNVLKGMIPPENLTVSEWAEKNAGCLLNRQLSRAHGERPGRPTSGSPWTPSPIQKYAG